ELAKPREELATVVESLRATSLKQTRMLQVLIEHKDEITPRDLARLAGGSISSVRSLLRAGHVRFTRKKVESDEAPLLMDETPVEKTAPLTPTPEQAYALKVIGEKLSQGGFGVVLLHGVTGSGKTEVYLQAIAQTIALGKQAIVLIPEISLTPQTVRRFMSRFDRVGVLHSGLTDGQRNVQWQRIRAGETDVVVGARSAVFAPMPRLGLVVVDEEHEPSFKQDNAPRYHGRDVAVMRAHMLGALVVLGSATPSLESYHNACSGKYFGVELTKRIDNLELPPVEVVDMTREMTERKGLHSLSRRLEANAKSALARKGQVLLFLNRRGFATYVTCKRCGFVLKCDRCDITLTYHRQAHLAICHHCNKEINPPTTCPECATPGVKYFGVGTERIEQELAKVFPGNSVMRMDSDTMRGRYAHGRALGAFGRGEVDILLGTQMIAKGLDFPNVTLVGVISADTALSLPDFRACERTFQLLAQVAGRTGRGPQGGRVVIQSLTPKHYTIQFAASHDYKGFAEKELEFRKQLGYPPFGRLAKIVVQGKNADAVKEKCGAIAQALRTAIAGRVARVLGPAEAPIAQLKRRHRWQVILKAQTSTLLHDLLKQAQPSFAAEKGAQVAIDIDPADML
ncbi:MAG: primosomal protein N', partial [Planctomycetes bacterium]|nr:primosomal protein N' [Planctomycetota bacterium]